MKISIRVKDGSGRFCRVGSKSVRSQPLYLWSLAGMLSYAGQHSEDAHGTNMPHLLEFFANSSKWPHLDVPVNAIPDYPVTGVDRTLNLGFRCETWGAGVIELFFKRDEFVHLGLQLMIRPSLFFGFRPRQERCIFELVAAAKDAYVKPITRHPIESGDGASVVFGDERTWCLIESAGGSVPRVTYRIWNRKHWNPDFASLGIA